MMTKLSLDGLWEFQPDPDGQATTQQDWPCTPPASRQPCVLPMPWNLFSPELFKYENVVWFFRTVPYLPAGEWLLAGEGANHRLTAWVDGVPIGSHEGGYLPFLLSIPERKEAGSVRLAIAVDNRLGPETLPPRGADWFNWGGIVRHLELRRRPKVRIADVTVRTEISGSFQIEACVEGRSGSALTARLLDPDGRQVWLDHKPASEDGSVMFHGRLADPQLWSPETPALYSLAITVDGDGDGDGRDCWISSVGFREIRTDGTQVLLNGRPIRLRGISRHESHPHVGNAGVAQIAYADVMLLKRAGANMVRLAHYPNDPQILDIADRLGLLVFAELPTIWLGEEQMADDEYLVRSKENFDALWRRDRHHPCIVLWGLVTESATRTQAGETFFAALAAHVRERDPDRLITQASETPDGDRCFQYADIVGLNYFHGWYSDAPAQDYGAALDELHRRFPDKPIMLSSHGADAIAGFRSLSGAKWSEEAQADYHVGIIEQLRQRPFVAGQCIWLLADYQGPAWRDTRFTPLSRPKEQNNKGLLDEYRRPKLAYDRVQALYQAWAKDVSDDTENRGRPIQKT